jgi:hypothetical protein
MLVYAYHNFLLRYTYLWCLNFFVKFKAIDAVMDEDKENLSDVADEDFDVPVASLMNFEQRLANFGDKGMWFEVGSAVRKNVCSHLLINLVDTIYTFTCAHRNGF